MEVALRDAAVVEGKRPAAPGDQVNIGESGLDRSDMPGILVGRERPDRYGGRTRPGVAPHLLGPWAGCTRGASRGVCRTGHARIAVYGPTTGVLAVETLSMTALSICKCARTNS